MIINNWNICILPLSAVADESTFDIRFPDRFLYCQSLQRFFIGNKCA
ncbi:hypothetical protein BFAG_04656 [Bacteroides fragilis 3_1_12]|uniref:Uncharacterized protein n=1 Tax=Bacteroides fragilis 3_1_12 TaxID=457424 RepID=A0ABN0BSX7_BACFG|nr:hypothetical protein BFAG_04656 [Bacteroides fragilis 3_1_12]